MVTTIRGDALGLEQLRTQLAAASRSPIGVLAAGHRDGRVVEQLVGDVDAGGDRGPDREAAGVGERAVAEVLDEVRLRRRTAPCRSTGRPRRPSA